MHSFKIMSFCIIDITWSHSHPKFIIQLTPYPFLKHKVHRSHIQNQTHVSIVASTLLVRFAMHLYGLYLFCTVHSQVFLQAIYEHACTLWGVYFHSQIKQSMIITPYAFFQFYANHTRSVEMAGDVTTLHALKVFLHQQEESNTLIKRVPAQIVIIFIGLERAIVIIPAFYSHPLSSCHIG